jgi:hypothetical protein
MFLLHLLRMKNKHVTSYESQEFELQLLNIYKSIGWVRKEEICDFFFWFGAREKPKRETQIFVLTTQGASLWEENELLYEKIMYNVTILYIKCGFCLQLESLSSRQKTSRQLRTWKLIIKLHHWKLLRNA